MKQFGNEASAVVTHPTMEQIMVPIYLLLVVLNIGNIKSKDMTKMCNFMHEAEAKLR